MIHTLQNSNGFPVQARQQRQQVCHPYLVGFKSPILARKVHYSMSGKEMPQLIRGVSPLVHPDHPNLCVDPEATLFIPKNTVKCHHPVEDLGYHLKTIPEGEFMGVPIRTMTGIVMGLYVLDETEDELVVRAMAIDAIPE
jgi:hypothetical protein